MTLKKKQTTRTICLTLFHPINTPANSTMSAFEFVINYMYIDNRSSQLHTHLIDLMIFKINF